MVFLEWSIRHTDVLAPIKAGYELIICSSSFFIFPHFRKFKHCFEAQVVLRHIRQQMHIDSQENTDSEKHLNT